MTVPSSGPLRIISDSSDGAAVFRKSRAEVQLSEALGDIESTFYKHKASPHPDIFCVSNDERKGFAASPLCND